MKSLYETTSRTVDCLLKYTSTKHNKYVVNQKLEPFDENSLRVMIIMGFLINNVFVEFGGHIVNKIEQTVPYSLTLIFQTVMDTSMNLK